MRFSKLGLRFEDGLVSYLGVPIEQFANNEKLSWGQGAECTVSLIRPRTIMTVWKKYVDVNKETQRPWALINDNFKTFLVFSFS